MRNNIGEEIILSTWNTNLSGKPMQLLTPRKTKCCTGKKK